jgi:hypothetical protein
MTTAGGVVILAIENPSNLGLGSIIRCAAAFRVDEVFIIGNKSYCTHGAHGAHRYVRQSHFHTWKEFFEAVSEQYNITGSTSVESTGVEEVEKLEMDVWGILFSQSMTSAEKNPSGPISKPVSPINEVHFQKPTCFILINYKFTQSSQVDLLHSYEQYCQQFVYVNFKNQEKDYLLHDDAKLSIILQQYAIQMGFPPVEFNQEKHVIDKSHIIQEMRKGRPIKRKPKMKDEDSLKQGNKDEKAIEEVDLFSLFDS